jgi:NTE family protein
MMWFVRSGSLGAFKRNYEGQFELVGHIRAGEPVGEMSMIAGEPHSASVYAIRDTELFGLSKQVFNRLIRSHPDLMQNLSRTILFRTKQSKRGRNDISKVFSLLSSSPTIDIEGRAQRIAQEVRKYGKTCLVVTESMANQGAKWFDEIEKANDVVLLISQLGTGLWPQTCLRQADRIWVFGRADAKPSTPLLPEDSSPAREFKLVDVVLIKDVGKKPISKGKEWLEASGAARILQWHEGRNEDIQTLARVIIGRSIGLVLSGGGARAFAHIGAIRALRDANIKFDFLGGTSMGGVIAACVAMGWKDEDIEQRLWKAFVETNPLNDYVLPVISFASGKKVDERLLEQFGDILIEDMQRPFFCVSSNLRTATPMIHRSGPLAKSLRASIALPGILPPVVDGDDVLVDGAVINNFPTNVLMDTHRGPNIGIDVTQQHALDANDYRDPPGFLQWILTKGFHSAPPIAELLMRAATINHDPSQARDNIDLLVVPEVGHVNLRDWRAFDTAVEAGYSATVKILQDDEKADIFESLRNFSA